MKTVLEDMAILRLPEVKRLTGLGKTTIYKLMNEGKFPAKMILTSRSVGWPVRDIRKWLAGISHAAV